MKGSACSQRSQGRTCSTGAWKTTGRRQEVCKDRSSWLQSYQTTRPWQRTAELTVSGLQFDRSVIITKYLFSCAIVLFVEVCTTMHRFVLQIDYPEIVDGLAPRHRFMSAYEQKIEPPDRKWQYLLFAAEPYETISFKVIDDWAAAINMWHMCMVQVNDRCFCSV